MPATTLYSAALTSAPNKVLVSQADINEESTGIIRAGITYVCKGTDLAEVSRRMILDSEPPAYPEIVFRDQIVLGKLFQQARTLETQYGIGKIRAFYVGVLNRGQDGTLQNDVETFSINFPITVEDVSRITGNYQFPNTIPAPLQLANNAAGNTALAGLFIEGRVTIRRVRFGAVINTPGALRELSNPPLSDMVLSARAQFVVALPTAAVLATAFGINQTDPQRIAEELRLLKTPVEWMEALPASHAISRESANEILTPSVVVINTTSRVFTNDLPVRLYQSV
jgi:hypothetical protein